jgi:hypothetical protein
MPTAERTKPKYRDSDDMDALVQPPIVDDKLFQKIWELVPAPKVSADEARLELENVAQEYLGWKKYEEVLPSLPEQRSALLEIRDGAASLAKNLAHVGDQTELNLLIGLQEISDRYDQIGILKPPKLELEEIEDSLSFLEQSAKFAEEILDGRPGPKSVSAVGCVMPKLADIVEKITGSRMTRDFHEDKKQAPLSIGARIVCTLLESIDERSDGIRTSISTEMRRVIRHR